MSTPIKIGHAVFTVARDADDRLLLLAEGYGRDRFLAAVFLGDREASHVGAIARRGALDVAPVIWETGEHADDATAAAFRCTHPTSGVRFDGGRRAVVCRACDLVLTHLTVDAQQ